MNNPEWKYPEVTPEVQHVPEKEKMEIPGAVIMNTPIPSDEEGIPKIIPDTSIDKKSPENPWKTPDDPKQIN